MVDPMRGSGSISYDLIHASDLTPERLEAFEHDLVRKVDLDSITAESGSA